MFKDVDAIEVFAINDTITFIRLYCPLNICIFGTRRKSEAQLLPLQSQ